MRLTRSLLSLALVFVLVAGLTAVTSRASAEIARVWAIDDGTKVNRDDTEHRLAFNNGIFDGKKISLFGARNEIVAFQILLNGGGQKTQNVKVKLESIGDIRNDGLSDDIDRYFIGRRIELFRQHYLKIEIRSRSIVWLPWTAAQPKGFRGKMVPDALVPLAAKDTIDVPAGHVQGVWVDVYIPKGTKPGIHRGKVVVEVDGQPCLKGCELPIELEVLEQTLPDVPTIKTMLVFSGNENDRDNMPSRYFKEPWAEKNNEPFKRLKERHFKLARRHQISLIVSSHEKPTDMLLARVTGKAFTKEAGYEGPGAGVGQDVYPINVYGQRKLTSAEANVWVAWFKEHAPKTEYFYYTKDEPKPKDYATVNQLAKAGKPAPSFTTAHYTGGLDVDYYCTIADHYDETIAQKGRKAGKTVWIYNGVRPYTGTFMTDDTAISPRVNPWIQYRYKIPRWFYWESTYYKDFQGGQGHIDVFNWANNFRNGDGDRLNGDGLLIYPGRDLRFPKSDQKIDHPLPSIRLKNWRRGIFDVEYLELARKAGHGAFVDKIVRAMVPRALKPDVAHTDLPVSWPDDGEKWLAARKLLKLVLTGKKKAGELEDELSTIGKPAEGSWVHFKRWIRRLKRAWWRGKRKLVVLGVAGTTFMVPVGIIVLIWLGRRKKRRAAR